MVSYDDLYLDCALIYFFYIFRLKYSGHHKQQHLHNINFLGKRKYIFFIHMGGYHHQMTMWEICIVVTTLLAHAWEISAIFEWVHADCRSILHQHGCNRSAIITADIKWHFMKQYWACVATIKMSVWARLGDATTSHIYWNPDIEDSQGVKLLFINLKFWR